MRKNPKHIEIKEDTEKLLAKAKSMLLLEMPSKERLTDNLVLYKVLKAYIGGSQNGRSKERK